MSLGRLTDRLTLLAREGLTRGWLTTLLLALDRGTELVSVGPPRALPTAPVATRELGGRCTTVVRAGVVRMRLTESTRFALGRARVTVPVRVLGARVTVLVRALVGRVAVWVRAGWPRERPTVFRGFTTPRPADGRARTVGGR